MAGMLISFKQKVETISPNWQKELPGMDLDAVFMAGGDGSVHKAVAGLLGSETSSGRLAIRDSQCLGPGIGIAILSWTNWTALEQSVRRLLNGHIQTMDVGICQGIPFLLWSGAGFDAFVVHHLEPRTRWQKQFPATQYAANVAWFARNWSGMDLKIWVDGERIEGTYILALVTNIHLYAGGMAEISPSARIDDGRMDLWLFSGDSMLETLQHLFDLAAGKHLDSENTIQYSCQEIKIKSNTDLYLQLDGEPISRPRMSTYQLNPKR